MRTIKFRAWDTKRNQWIPADDISVGGDGRIWLNLELLGWVECPAHIILMQSTGLFDKNGVEIWEGDVVRGQFQYGDDFGQATGEIEEIIKVVRWDEGMQKWPGFQVGEINFGEFPVEVLGNCFENPHLLEQK